MIANESLAAEPARRLRPATAALALVSALVAAGCSQNKEAFTKRLDQLRADIVQLRAENLALQDRVAELEDLDQGAAPAKPPVNPAAGRPALKVIRLTPDTGQGLSTV